MTQGRWHDAIPLAGVHLHVDTPDHVMLSAGAATAGFSRQNFPHLSQNFDQALEKLFPLGLGFQRSPQAVENLFWARGLPFKQVLPKLNKTIYCEPHQSCVAIPVHCIDI